MKKKYVKKGKEKDNWKKKFLKKGNKKDVKKTKLMKIEINEQMIKRIKKLISNKLVMKISFIELFIRKKIPSIFSFI